MWHKGWTKQAGHTPHGRLRLGAGCGPWYRRYPVARTGEASMHARLLLALSAGDHLSASGSLSRAGLSICIYPGLVTGQGMGAGFPADRFHSERTSCLRPCPLVHDPESPSSSQSWYCASADQPCSHLRLRDARFPLPGPHHPSPNFPCVAHPQSKSHPCSYTTVSCLPRVLRGALVPAPPPQALKLLATELGATPETVRPGVNCRGAFCMAGRPPLPPAGK